MALYFWCTNKGSLWNVDGYGVGVAAIDMHMHITAYGRWHKIDKNDSLFTVQSTGGHLYSIDILTPFTIKFRLHGLVDVFGGSKAIKRKRAAIYDITRL